MTSSDLDRLARAAYDAYRSTHQGPVPGWGDLSEQERQAWYAAVTAATGQRDATLTEAAIRAPSLIVQAGGDTKVFHADFTAGRQGALAVGDEHASGQHARFQFAHSFWYVEDLDSTNGTWLNGRRIFAAQRLKKGDKIRIGRTTVTVVSV